jgi:hypothetical protein
LTFSISRSLNNRIALPCFVAQANLCCKLVLDLLYSLANRPGGKAMPVLHCPLAKEDWLHKVGERNGVSVPPTPYPAAKPVEDAGPWESAVQKIIEYQRLGDNWDGFGAKAPSQELLQSAIGLAYVFRENGVDPPHRLAPGVDGSVIFEWQDPDGTYTDVEIVRPLHAECMRIEPGQPAKHWTLPTE